jgi:hypothetical protein
VEAIDLYFDIVGVKKVKDFSEVVIENLEDLRLSV